MTGRRPTREELRLWQESNRFTTRFRPEDADADGVDAPASELTPEAAVARPVPVATGRVRILSALPVLSGRDAMRQFKPYPLDATLDLHGLGKLASYTRVQQFIREQHHRGRRHVAIITGKGRGQEAGILRRELPHWLNEPAMRPLLSAIAYAPAEKGGAGVAHVLLKRA
jgi:hypothetical protein